MAKRSHKQSVAQQGNQQLTHTSYEEDDNMLPAPEVLHQYQQMDDRFIDWFMNRADLEQSARIRFNDERINIAKSTNVKLFTIDIVSIIISAMIIGLLVLFSYKLIDNGHEIVGSIFGGTTVIIYAIRLLNFRRVEKNNE